MKLILRKAVITFLFFTSSVSLFAQLDSIYEGSNEKASSFFNAFGPHDPVFFALGYGKNSDFEDKVIYANFQISFRFEIFSIAKKENQSIYDRYRGFNLIYSQLSFWDLSSKSQPFYDTSYKPGLMFLYQKIDGQNISWIHRIDLEGGFQHHSNGRETIYSRSTNQFYFKPTLVWKSGGHHFFFAPKVWTYWKTEKRTKDIQDYWGNADFELTWRAKWGLQLESHSIFAKNVNTFHVIATYPVDRFIKRLKFYIMLDYWNGAGNTILRYNESTQGFIGGIALTR
ncbi:phospholipase A [Reichenbachiella sp.]|uniref:phospholipase A n=1 Tax=Reichenbachiella sp. TaxID=2184521 RepID=UPI003B58E37C